MATKATMDAASAAATAGKATVAGSKVWIAVAATVVAAGVVGGALIISGNNQSGSDALPKGAKLGYAEGVVAVDQRSLQDLVDEMRKVNKGQLVTEYRNDAVSTDGTAFRCYVGNSERNIYDMYIQIFSDAEMTDQLFLSELLRPGTVFKEITLEHPLEVGTHRVYVVFTQVEDDLATAVGQVTVTMDFTVIE